MTAIAPPRANPFLDISPLARLLILFYLIAYRVVFPLIHALMSDGAKDLLAPRFLAELCLTVLIAFPFLFHRREYGWLHPLVLPALFAIGKGITKNPFTLVFPLKFPTVDFTVETMSKAASLSLAASDLAWVRLQYSGALCLAAAIYLLAFLAGPKLQIPRIKVYSPRNIAAISMAAITLLLGISLIFILWQGGVYELLVAMRGGRTTLFEGQGQYLFAAGLATTIATVWFAYEHQPWHNPLLIGTLIVSMLVGVVTSGSRSSLIMSAIILLLLWWKRSGRVLLIPTLAVAALSLVVIGAFGSIRQDYGSTAIETSLLNPGNYREAIDRALVDIEGRANEETDLAVMAGVGQKGHLGGRTYAGAAAFFVPRALWSSKPRSADVYNMWVNFANQPIDVPLPEHGVWGIPVSAQMEAYWSFGAVGVITLFAALGIAHSALARAACVYDKLPFFWVLYLLALVTFSGVSREIVDLFRNLAVLGIFATATGIIRVWAPESGSHAAR